MTHYNDVIMGVIASQFTSFTILYSTVYSRRRSKKTSKLRVTGLCEGNSPVTGKFPAQKASNAENVSISWRHYGNAIAGEWRRMRETEICHYANFVVPTISGAVNLASRHLSCFSIYKRSVNKYLAVSSSIQIAPYLRCSSAWAG